MLRVILPTSNVVIELDISFYQQQQVESEKRFCRYISQIVYYNCGLFFPLGLSPYEMNFSHVTFITLNGLKHSKYEYF